MVKDWRPIAGALLGIGAALGVYWAVKGRPSLPALSTTTSGGKQTADKAVPRIGLDRLNAHPPATDIGTRDIFDFGAPPPTPVPPPTTSPATMAAGPPVPVVPTPTPLPPLTVKYIGTLETPQGLKLAVLMTDKKEILTGQTGEVVGNRYKIVKIGLESVDLQQVGADRVQRVPLRGN